MATMPDRVYLGRRILMKSARWSGLTGFARNSQKTPSSRSAKQRGTPTEDIKMRTAMLPMQRPSPLCLVAAVPSGFPRWSLRL